MIDYVAVLQEANKAAQAAGEKWLAEAEARGPRFNVYDAPLFSPPSEHRLVGTMLDNCGNAYIEFKDRRSADYKRMKAAGLLKYSGSGPQIDYPLRCRQEHGLHIAAMQAAFQVLVKSGITGVRVRDYID